MSRKPNLDKFHDVLFNDFDEQQHLSPVECDQLKRYRAAYAQSLENPSIPDIQLRDYLVKEFGISQTQAYCDIANIRVLLGNVRNASKEWMRYLINETLKEAIAKCKLTGDWKKVILATNVLGKYNRLDKEDSTEYPWEEILPTSIEPTNDVTVLKVKPLANKEDEIRKMYEKYKGEIDIEDIGYEEVENERND
ncbi:MAG TPA: hypothetical protein VFC67_09240 [Prolixibacteraceae bacterium]|nr:hypothetical protein [Prolixibacteraceae bacterium]